MWQTANFKGHRFSTSQDSLLNSSTFFSGGRTSKSFLSLELPTGRHCWGFNPPSCCCQHLPSGPSAPWNTSCNCPAGPWPSVTPCMLEANSGAAWKTLCGNVTANKWSALPHDHVTAQWQRRRRFDSRVECCQAWNTSFTRWAAAPVHCVGQQQHNRCMLKWFVFLI